MLFLSEEEVLVTIPEPEGGLGVGVVVGLVVGLAVGLVAEMVVGLLVVLMKFSVLLSVLSVSSSEDLKCKQRDRK